MPCVPSAGSAEEGEEILLAFLDMCMFMCAYVSVCACNCLLLFGFIHNHKYEPHEPSGRSMKVRVLYGHNITTIPGELGRK